jgi:IS30 family transposase
LIPGHWEGYLLKGAFNRSCVDAQVERKTRFFLLYKRDGCSAGDALKGLMWKMKKLPHFLIGSLTHDRRTEMTCYKEFMRGLNTGLWFADLHVPSQRGTKENANGLLRQFCQTARTYQAPVRSILTTLQT